MKHRQFDPKQFVERKRFKFWSEMQRKPGESVLELAARIPRAAASSNFTAVRLITQLLIAVSKTLFVIFAKLQVIRKGLSQEGATMFYKLGEGDRRTGSQLYCQRVSYFGS